MVSTVIVVYCWTSYVSGITAIRMHGTINGKDWFRCTIFACSLFLAPLAAVFLGVDLLASSYGTTRAVPLVTILTVTIMHVIPSFALTFLGAYVARRNNASTSCKNCEYTSPHRIHEEPEKSVGYPIRILLFQIVVVTVLLFVTISDVLFHILHFLWDRLGYIAYGVIILRFLLLVTCLSLMTAALTSCQVQRRGGCMHVPAFVNGGLTGIFIFVYSINFYRRDTTGMNGSLQASFYFGFMFIVSYAIFLMIGSVSFQFSIFFFKQVRARVKRARDLLDEDSG